MKPEFIQKVEVELIKFLEKDLKEEIKNSYEELPIEKSTIQCRHLKIEIIESLIFLVTPLASVGLEFFDDYANEERFQEYLRYVKRELRYYLENPNAKAPKVSFLKSFLGIVTGKWKGY